MTVRPSVSSVISRFGRMHTIKRSFVLPGANEWTAGIATVTYSTVMMHRRHYRPSEVRGLIRELDVLFTMGPGALILPANGDMIASGIFTAANDATALWAQVINVRPCEDGNAYGAVKIQGRI